MRVINVFIFSLFISVFNVTPAYAARATSNANERIGAGIEVGTFAAITGKYWFEAEHALDFGVAFGFDHWTQIYADFLWHRAQIFGTNTEFTRQTTGYVGGGIGLAFHQQDSSCGRWKCGNATPSMGVAARGLVGAEWQPAISTPIGIFAELIPAFLIGPSVTIGIDAGVGGRYYF